MLVQLASVLNAPVAPVKFNVPLLKNGCVSDQLVAGFTVEVVLPIPKLVPTGNTGLSNPWIDNNDHVELAGNDGDSQLIPLLYPVTVTLVRLICPNLRTWIAFSYKSATVVELTPIIDI